MTFIDTFIFGINLDYGFYCTVEKRMEDQQKCTHNKRNDEEKYIL